MHPTEQPAGAERTDTSVTFSNPLLKDYAWPVCEITGAMPGPRLCVTAGVHVNEVSSIEAAIRLQSRIPEESLRGSVSIMPIVNLPALYEYTEYNCPVDGKNINFTFPGRPDGTFSEVLCHALLFEWAKGADCYIDLHGGDLREEVSKFVMYQRVGDAALDLKRRQLAQCFDADIVVGFDPEFLALPGRPPTACARFGMTSIMSEAGANGLVDEDSVMYHVNGVLNIARLLGMRGDELQAPTRPQHLSYDYQWVTFPADGLFYSDLRPGQHVKRGQKIGEVKGFFGEHLGVIEAPVTGYVLWRMTQPILKRDNPVLAVAVPVDEEETGTTVVYLD